MMQGAAAAKGRASVSWSYSVRRTVGGNDLHSHYATPPSRVPTSANRLKMVEIRHQALHSPQVPGQHVAGLGGPERRVAADVAHHADERRWIESGPLSDRFDELHVV